MDGPSKVTGAARYPADFGCRPGARGLVQSTVAAGRIRRIATARPRPPRGAHGDHARERAALAEPERVLGPLRPARCKTTGCFTMASTLPWWWRRPWNRRPRRRGWSRPTTRRRLRSWDSTTRGPGGGQRWRQRRHRGDVAAGLAAAEVIAPTYTTAGHTNNPLGLFATVARWDGDLLTVHDATQGPVCTARRSPRVRSCPRPRSGCSRRSCGGAFGAGLRAWPHVILAALAARVAGRPVKLVLTRPQMFTSVGHRPQTVQRMRLGATARRASWSRSTMRASTDGAGS